MGGTCWTPVLYFGVELGWDDLIDVWNREHPTELLADDFYLDETNTIDVDKIYNKLFKFVGDKIPANDWRIKLHSFTTWSSSIWEWDGVDWSEYNFVIGVDVSEDELQHGSLFQAEIPILTNQLSTMAKQLAVEGKPRYCLGIY